MKTIGEKTIVVALIVVALNGHFPLVNCETGSTERTRRNTRHENPSKDAPRGNSVAVSKGDDDSMSDGVATPTEYTHSRVQIRSNTPD